MGTKTKIVSSGFVTIVAALAIASIVYQMSTYDYKIIKCGENEQGIGIYNTEIRVGDKKTYMDNKTFFGCNSPLSGTVTEPVVGMDKDSFNRCQIVDRIFPLQILAIMLLSITLVPKMNMVGIPAGFVSMGLAVLVYFDYGGLVDDISEKRKESGEECDVSPGMSFWFNVALAAFGLLMVGKLLFGTTMGRKSKKQVYGW